MRSTRPTPRRSRSVRTVAAAPLGRPVEALEGRLLLATTTLSNGTGDRAVTVHVDGYGAFVDTTYDPVGEAGPQAIPVVEGLYVSLFQQFLSEQTLPPIQFLAANANSAVSTFAQAGVSATLTQTLNAPDASGISTLEQQYQITNNTGAPLTLTFVRHLDAHISFGNAAHDVGGVTGDGLALYEFDNVGAAATSAGFVGIASLGGTHVGYAIQPAEYTDDILLAGGIPTADLNVVPGDTNADRLTEQNIDYTLSLQNALTIANGATETFTTMTRFGEGVAASVIAGPSTLPPPEQDPGFTPINIDFAAEAIATQSDGRLVLAGHRLVSPGVTHAMIQRFNADGTPDATFGTAGIVESAAGANEAFYSLAIQNDDKIVVSGRSGSDFVIARFNADGAPDTTFGTAGRTLTNFGGAGGATAFALALGPGGTIVLGGGANGAFAFARYTSTGALDPTFGTGGTKTFDIGTTNDAIGALAVQSDGKIIVAGAGGDGTQVLVTRLNPDSSPDLTFGGGLVVLAIPGLAARTDLGVIDATVGLAVQPDNKILVANRTVDGNFGVVRLTSQGIADTAFGLNGIATADFGGDDDADSVVIQPGQGQVLVVGTSATGPTGAVAIAAFNADGTPVANFGNAGKVIQGSGQPALRTFRSGGTIRKALSSVQPRTRRLVTGASDQSDTDSSSSFSRVLVPGSLTETVIGTFGTVAGEVKPQKFVVPGTAVTLSLKGGGTAQAITDTLRPGEVKLVVTGTNDRSVLSVKGRQRLPLSDVSVAGPIGRIVARTADLSGTLFVNGAASNITLANVAGSPSSPAAIAVNGPVRSISLANLGNARVLSGVNVGNDGVVGGGDDTYGAGRIQSLKVRGAIANSFVGAGVNPQNGVFGDAGDTVTGGPASSIDRITAKGGVDAATLFEAGAFGRIRKLGRERINVPTDPRFRVL
jgi:uncharacterized delta-60 repeat protein